MSRSRLASGRGSSRHWRSGRPLPRIDVGFLTLVVSVIVATWVGHTIEYFRVFGPSQFRQGAFRSVHTYMGVTGLLLLAVASVAVQVSLRLSRRLDAWLASLRAGRHLAPPPASAFTGRLLSVASVTCMIWLTQLVLYVVAENVEAHLFGVHAPGLSALTGVHALAALVHLDVALLVTVGLWLLRRRVATLREAVRSAWAALAAPPRVGALSPTAQATRVWTPGERFGLAVWGRPPPSPAVA